MKALTIIILAFNMLVTTAAIPEDTRLIKVAIIDTGLDLSDYRFRGKLCKTGHRSFSGSINDIHGHGTHVAGLIVKYGPPDGYCLMIIKYYEEHNKGRINLANTFKSIKHAINNGAMVINYSGGGSTLYKKELNIIRNSPHVTFVIAAGNGGMDVSKSTKNRYYPASYDLPNIVAVGSLDLKGKKLTTSNYGDTIDAWEIGLNVVSTVPNGICWHKSTYNCLMRMSGTSQATAIATGKLLRKLIR